MPERTPTGIGELDRILGGGLPEGTVTLAYGGPGVGKSLFGMQFLKAGLDKGEACAYHLLDRPYPWLVKYLETLGSQAKEAIEEGRLSVLQSFPHFFPFPRPQGMVYLPSGQLQEIREYFMGKEPKRLIIGSLRELPGCPLGPRAWRLAGMD
jgi:KaiC/GvpD/RAD55 family RecA-like ATPase